MSIFPLISTIEEFRSNVMHKEEIRENTIHDNCHAFCYMISSENTFDSNWLRECRGIVFYDNPHRSSFVISRPLHKFFNVGEREETRVENLDWSKVARIMDKMDGSTIHTVSLEFEVKLKSKKTFTSDVAKAAQAYADANKNITQFMQSVVSAGCTAIFEYVAPDARIVLYYPEPKLVLLHIRNNYDGHYYTAKELKAWADIYGVEVVEEPVFDVPKEQLGTHLLELAKTIEGIEGWIIQFENGDMVKLKTEWYLKRHRAMTFLRERDIAILTIDEGLDDLKALLVSEGADISEILKIEQDVVQRMNNITNTCKAYVDRFKHLDRKEFALAIQNEDPTAATLFGMIMQTYLGREPSIKEYFMKHVLKDVYSLRQLNLMQSVAEAD